MNNRRASYYPVLIYTAALALVWLASLLAGIFQLVSDSNFDGNSLLSAPGLRWAVRNALPSIDAAPWGTALMLIAIAGLLRGSGILRLLSRLMRTGRLTKNEKRASLFALAALLSYSALLYFATVAPWNLLLGVTGELSLSPVMQGWLILLFTGVLFVSLVYGFVYGNYRSMSDVVVSAGDLFALSVPALMAMIPASGLVPCLQYTSLLDVGNAEGMIYALPFLYVAVLNMRHK